MRYSRFIDIRLNDLLLRRFSVISLQRHPLSLLHTVGLLPWHPQRADHVLHYSGANTGGMSQFVQYMRHKHFALFVNPPPPYPLQLLGHI